MKKQSTGRFGGDDEHEVDFEANNSVSYDFKPVSGAKAKVIVPFHTSARLKETVKIEKNYFGQL